MGLEISASHFSRGKVGKVENWVYWCDCGTPVVGMHVLRCSLKNTCGYETLILHHIFLEIILPVPDCGKESGFPFKSEFPVGKLEIYKLFHIYFRVCIR